MSSVERQRVTAATLGRTGIEVTRIGFGTAPVASLFWANDETTARSAATRALAAGVTLFDTAPFYGMGEAETRLGAALGSRGGDVVIATKAGRLLEPGADGMLDARFDFSHDAALVSLESSLGRLGVDRVDIVHIHDPDDHIEAALAGTYRALATLRDEGVIRAVSLGTNLVATAEVFLERADLDCMLVAGRYTLLDQSAAGLIRRCAEQDVAFMAAGVFNSGVLARPVDGSWYDYAPVPAETLERAQRIEAICRGHDVPLRTAALRFPLLNPDVPVVVAGMAAPAEVDENVDALGAELPADLWRELEAEQLIIDLDESSEGRP